MKKLLVTALSLTLLSANCVAFAKSQVSIPLPGSNVVAPKSELKVSLDSLDNKTPYKVSCTIETTAPNGLQMNFTPQFAPKGGYGVAKLNDKNISNNSIKLQNGKNTLTFIASVADNSKANDFVLKNMDESFTGVLGACEATPISIKKAAQRVAGDYFFVDNDLPFFLDIAVGDYFPVGYCIPPYSTQYIEVSTYNQDIEVIRTHY